MADKIMDKKDTTPDNNAIEINPDELERRIYELAAEVTELCEKMPKSTPLAEYIASRLKRSATVAATTFAEALREEKKRILEQEVDGDSKKIN